MEAVGPSNVGGQQDVERGDPHEGADEDPDVRADPNQNVENVGVEADEDPEPNVGADLQPNVEEGADPVRNVRVGADDDPNIRADPEPNVDPDQAQLINDLVDRFVEGWNQVIIYGR